MIRPILSGLAAGLLLVGCATVADNVTTHAAHDYPEARSYDVSENAMADVDAALSRAVASDKRVMIVMGANWCHDSRALAGWLGTDRFAALIDAKYELVFVNVGMPQSGDGHNIAIAQRFGLDALPGTPNVLIVTADGTLINADTATTWRDAASREEDAIYDELVSLAN
ncbi:thioredoxin family protein [Erythrobacter sp. Alg231-14]|uniref:thioredoxin family protein n=1 Tax=Erythrobacter sp. Alg231-14 TaxID=1922225 RepID=UPI000D5620D9